MNIPNLGVLTDVNLREAWPHEALSFTPWLAEHLEALSAVIGIPLEFSGREVRVDPFFADILATNPQDGKLVLIENQLGGADHNHLGQILTYLAGLEAQTIVWVAREFTEAHLSALRWLNTHTEDPFAFFAVRVRAVRIGNSPIAPIFEVVEKPNQWERTLEAIANETHEPSELTKRRKDFWTEYLTRFPDEGVWGPLTATSNRWRYVEEARLAISLYIATNHVGLFIRGPRTAIAEAIYEQLLEHDKSLAAALGATLESSTPGYFCAKEKNADTSNRAIWPELIDWLHAAADSYTAALREAFRESRTEGDALV